ncbi:hypothetical protein FF38_07159 [Lucilia cuprina]|uniref:Uncharacterized protein n=1 Tax=Lucilia cuprina TaxID=7375 RepID=A0A0L0CNM7_LUCCU|nr:hypothetical protein FF38_07159 [Lucilia cuprina]
MSQKSFCNKTNDITALHWAAKQGNEDVVKLIAGTYKADVNAQTGYTPLHIAMQFGRSNIFALLCNTYKANRDLLDWAGNKPLDYSKQQTSVSASTYSSEYCSKFLLNELNNNYHFQLPPNMKNVSGTGKLAIGGGTVGSALVRGKKRSQLTSPLTRTQSLLTQTSAMRRQKKTAVQSVKYGNDYDDGNLIPCDMLPSPQSSPESSPRSLSPKNIRHGTVARRKESFLRKTLRAATSSRSNNNPDNVTNQTRKPTVEKDSGFLRIGSLNVRVKKTTEAFSNFLGVGNGTIHSHHQQQQQHHHPHAVSTVNHPHQRHHRHHHYPHHLHAPGGMMRNQHHLHPMMMKKSATMTMKNPPSSLNHHHHHLPTAGSRASVPINSTKYDMLHKSWGSADNITQNGLKVTKNYNNDDEEDDEDSLMPPPKGLDSVKKRQKNTTKRSSISSNATDSPRDSISSTSSSNFNSGYSSMPTTPNQLRSPLGLGVPNNLTADSDSDSACGFDSNWSINGRSSLSSGNLKTSKY